MNNADTKWTQRDGAGHPITGRAPIAAARLIGDFEATYLKFNGREPRTLEEVQVARAEREHRARVAEIKAMGKRLAELQQFVPQLHARGIRIGDRRFSTLDRGQTLRIESQMFGKDDKLLAALLDLGFSEVERKALFRDEESVTVKHGRWLRLQVTVTRAPRAAL